MADALSKGKYYIQASSAGTTHNLSPNIRRVNLPPTAVDQNFTAIPRYGTLTGRVTDKDSGKVIAQARVSAGGVVGKTDTNGNYLLKQILPGNHNLYVTSDNYKRYKGEVNIRANTSTTRNVRLKPILVEGYRLPWPAGRTYACTQGNNSPFSHSGQSRYAYDFGMSVGNELVATRKGRVLWVKENSGQGGCWSGYFNSANYVGIVHEDGSVSLYVHLNHNGVVVSPGQEVKSGQIIGYSGQTGWSCGPHLHYERRASQWNRQTIETRFLDVSTHGGIPVTGRRYTSGNHLIASLEDVGPQADTTAPTGQVSFRMTGTPTHTLEINAFDYHSPMIEMKLANSETDLTSVPWQKLSSVTDTTSIDWTDFEAWVQFRDESGNVSQVYSDTVEAINFEPVQASFTISPTTCVGSPPQINNQTTPFCEQCGWEWDLGDGNVSLEAEPLPPYPYVGYPETGAYTVTLKVANANSTSSDSKQVTVLPSPSPEFNITHTEAKITVEAVTTEAKSWTWNFGDGTTATGRTATHTYTDSSIIPMMPIQLRVEGHNGCTSEVYQFILAEQKTFLPVIIKQ